MDSDKNSDANDEITNNAGYEMFADVVFMVCSYFSAYYQLFAFLYDMWSIHPRMIVPIYRSTHSTRGFLIMTIGDRVHENVHKSMNWTPMEIFHGVRSIYTIL